MLSSVSGKYFAGHLIPKRNLLPGATVYINFDLGSFPGSGTEFYNLTNRYENMILSSTDYTYRPTSPNSIQFTNSNQGVIELPAGVCSLNDNTAIAICVWVKPKVRVGVAELFSYVPQNPSPGNLQTFKASLDFGAVSIQSAGSSTNNMTSSSTCPLLLNQWNMLTICIKGGINNYPRLYLDATVMDNRSLIMNYNSTQPMKFIFPMSSQWETEWNNLQVWQNAASINPATKFAAERAYYGR